MTGPVRVVTDSTAGLSPERAAQQGITVVSLGVTAGPVDGLEGQDVQPADVVAALRSRQPVTTSQPSPAAFTAAYAGTDEVVSIHLSAALSGTCDAARRVASGTGGRVHVLDSQSISAGLGFAVSAAASAADAGGDVAAVTAAARDAVAATTVLFCVDDLEFLHRGGRIGAAAALVGSALSVKPLLRLRDGTVVVDGKVRTAARAVERLVHLAGAAAGTGGGPVQVAVMHVDAAARAEQLVGLLAAGLGDRVVGAIPARQLSAVVAAHTGPGAFGVAIRAC